MIRVYLQQITLKIMFSERCDAASLH